MDRRRTITETCAVLAKAGFYISDPDLFRTVNFDIIARRDDTLLLIKVLTNIDAMKKEVAEQMLLVSKHIGAFPLLIGYRNNTDALEEGIVYMRYGIPVMVLSTLVDYFIEGVPPFILSAPGGPYVNIDGEEMKRIRTTRGISLGNLAKAAGVSRKSIQLYESGGKAKFNVVMKMEEFLGHPVAKPVNPFDNVGKVEEAPLRDVRPGGPFAERIFNRLRGLGFYVISTVKCPFDALSEEKKTLILTGLGKRNKTALEKARVIASISRIAEKDAVLVMNREISKTNISGTPVISRRELEDLDGTEDVIDMVKERKK